MSEQSSDLSLDRKIGQIVKEERIARDLTAEEAARRAKVAYKTWKRIESGDPVRGRSLSGVDRLFGLPLGTTLRARDDVYGLDLRAEIQRAGRATSGTAELDLSARGASHVAKFGQGAEANAEGSVPAITGRGSVVAPAAVASGHGQLRAGGMTTVQLLDLVLGLDLDDLRRLCDLANGALQARNHPDIENELLAARGAREHAEEVMRAAEDQLQYLDKEVNSLTYRLQLEELTEDDKKVVDEQLTSAETSLMQARESLNAALRMLSRTQNQYYILSEVHAQIQKFRNVEMARGLKDGDNGQR